MGCGPSKEDAEGGAAARCRERKHLLGLAVQARHALAGAHAGHAAALKNVGAALSDYAAGETDRHDAVVVPRSASAAAALTQGAGPAATATVVKALPSTLDAVLPPPPPPPGAIADGAGDDADAGLAAPLQRSISAPDIQLNIRKGRSGEAPTIMEEEEGEGGDDDAAVGRRRREDDDDPPPPPPLPPANTPPPPPSRSPPPVPSNAAAAEAKAAASEGDSFHEYIFGSPDGMPGPVPTLDPSASAAAESSWAAERRMPAPPPPPPTAESDQPPPPKQQQSQPPVPSAEEIAEGKKPAAEVVTRRAVTQKGKKGRLVMVQPPTARLGDILRRLDDHFLKASQGAHEVSKLLEAARMHYHSNFAETRGFVDHSARVMQVITWNRSFKGIPQPENVKNDDDDEWETHATVLDKLLAWEKKLCHEVKDFEVIKVTYQRKLAVLNKKKQRGVSTSSIEKTKSLVSHLHTKYIVDLQTMESTVAEIDRLRDQKLYPKLLELVKGMSHMWDIIYTHHKAQLRIITELKASDIKVSDRETSEQHNERTVQLYHIVQEWHVQFDRFMTFQKEYVGSLYSWVKLNVIPIDTNLKPNSSQPHETTPPIKRLLHAWHDILDKLPVDATKKAIHTFAEVVHTILVHQDDELKLRIKINETRRDLEKKRRQFDDWAQKNYDRGASIPDGDNPGRADPAAERKAVVDRVENALKELEDSYKTQCKVVRDKSLSLLRSNLPELFRAVSDFSLQSAGYFKGLWSIAQTNDQLDD